MYFAMLSASVGFAVAMCAAFLGGSLPVVSVLACAVVFILEFYSDMSYNIYVFMN